MTDTPALLPAVAYIAEITKQIEAATNRVLIMTTTLHNDCPEIEGLVAACEAAAARGVTVSLLADSLTYTEIKGSLLNLKRQQLRGVEAMKLARRLKKAGVQFRWLGRDTSVGFIGRTHTKWTVIDDMVYTFGGVNLDKVSFENTDMMLQLKDAGLAAWLDDCHQAIIDHDRAHTGMRNRSLDDPNGKWRILLDGGIPGNSDIYARATELARQAVSVTAVSQYCPTGKLMRAMKHCPKHRIYFNRLSSATWLNRIILSLGLRNHRHNNYKRAPYLHAKYILYTLPDGRKVALTGSHNFVRETGMVGTREIALETTDPHIIALLEDFTKNAVA
ncbi:MAG: phospholipase D-like domain-containing protein [Candidatus Saccharibacteria bacterium]|nr:phospholipase D-like domain-containing protein [Candidatus Saccharibacteria bacterium]